MKKVLCIKCGAKRGRRQCIKYIDKYLCGDCCSSIQIDTSCPEDCVHIGKLNQKDLNNKVRFLIDTGIQMKRTKPFEALALFDKALKLDKNNYCCYLEKSDVYEILGQYSQAIECLKDVLLFNDSGDTYYKFAVLHRKENKYSEVIDIIKKHKEKINDWEANLLLGDCYYMMGHLEIAEECLKNVISNPQSSREDTDKAKVILSNIYFSKKDIDKMMEVAETISDAYENEKLKLIENGYFASGRMYELLNLINSMDKLSYMERFLLLQCSLVLKKNNQGSIINIINDILNSDFCTHNTYEENRLIGLKVKLLFKDLKANQAYEVFDKYQAKMLSAAKDIFECKEACHLIAFFLYNLDKSKSVAIYQAITGMAIDEFIIDELYNAFTTMEVSPYVRAKAIEKSFELMRAGKSGNFNRTGIVADLLYEYGDYSQAYDMFCRSDNEKMDTLILYKMAMCLIKQNKFDEAFEAFINVSALTKYISGVYPGIIKCCLETDRDWSDFYKCLELEKLNFNEIYELAGSLMSKEYYDKSGYLYNYILDKYKNMDIYSRKTIYHNLVCVYRNLKEYNKAIKLIEEIPDKYYGSGLLVDIGCLFSDINQYDKSQKMFEEAVSIYDNYIINFNIGLLNMKMGNYSKALDSFKLAINKLINEIRNKKAYIARDYGNMLVKLYSNTSLCLLELDKEEEALLSIEKALCIERNTKVMEIVSIIQKRLLDKDKGIDKEVMEDTCYLIDNCMQIKEGFTEDIRRLLDDTLNKVYGKNDKIIGTLDNLEESITAFIKNERRIYNKYRESIERSEGTFQRYVDNLLYSFERKVVSESLKEAAVTLEGDMASGDILQYSNILTSFGDEMLRNFEYGHTEDYIYASLIPYYKIIKYLSTIIVFPYYKKNINMLPVPSEPSDFKDIGVYCYKAGGQSCYRIDFSFNISCSEYLFGINCHPGLRNEYLDFQKHYMPWDKLMWLISGVKKRWNIIDDAKSVGLLLLFYSSYKNYLGIEGDFNSSEEIINLAGDLIQLSNERDYYIRSMLNGNYEFDYLSSIMNVREIAKRCIDGLLKIKRIE